MTLRNRSDNGLLYVGFNQDQGCFACGMEDGFRIFNCDPMKQKERHNFTENGGIAYVEMLFRCNYLALVGGGPNPRFPLNKVVIWDDLKKVDVTMIEFQTDVRSVRLRRDRIVVVLDREIRVFTFTLSPQRLHSFETSNNPKGLCCLCPSSSPSLLAFPGTKTGSLRVVDLGNVDQASVDIQAHENPLSCLSMNLEGTMLATASDKGTLIRIFNSESGEMHHELRRGTQQANIYCINFNQCSDQLCVSSDHGTVHVFTLPASDNSQRNSVFLPKYFSCQRSSASFQIPGGHQSICAFNSDGKSVNAVCADGSFYKFAFTPSGDFSREFFANFLTLYNVTAPT